MRETTEPDKTYAKIRKRFVRDVRELKVYYHIDESTIITTRVFDEDSYPNSCKLDIKETIKRYKKTNSI